MHGSGLGIVMDGFLVGNPSVFMSCGSGGCGRRCLGCRRFRSGAAVVGAVVCSSFFVCPCVSDSFEDDVVLSAVFSDPLVVPSGSFSFSEAVVVEASDDVFPDEELLSDDLSSGDLVPALSVSSGSASGSVVVGSASSPDVRFSLENRSSSDAISDPSETTLAEPSSGFFDLLLLQSHERRSRKKIIATTTAPPIRIKIHLFFLSFYILNPLNS